MAESIPNKIHAIWIGSVLNEEGRNNLVNWKTNNPTYEVNLWVDSSLYDEKNQNEFQSLKSWAKLKDIRIYDVSHDSKKDDDYVVGRSDIYQNMLGNRFYNDEINGNYKNLAAASDILRSEILYQEGGIYIDVQDIFPNMKLPEQMQTDYGFYYHQESNGFMNNDILASISEGTIISKYRNAIYANYILLYQNENKLNAHRNPEFTNPNIFHGANPRKVTTLITSGPGALDAIIMQLMMMPTIVPEAEKPLANESDVKFPENYYKMPDKQASSWFDPNAASKYEVVIPILKTYIKEYFNIFIDEQIQLKSNNHSLIEQLKQLKIKLNGLPPSASMNDVYNNVLENLSNSKQKQIDKNCNNLLSSLKNVSKTLERLIEIFIKNGIEAKDIAKLLDEMGPAPKFQYDLKTFVKDILDKKGGKPDLSKLVNYGLQIPNIRESQSNQSLNFFKPEKVKQQTHRERKAQKLSNKY